MSIRETMLKAIASKDLIPVIADRNDSEYEYTKELQKKDVNIIFMKTT